MRSTAVAKRYARALFALAREEGRIDAVAGELDGLGSLLDQSRELRDALLTPLHPAAQRKAVLNALSDRLGLSATMRHFHAFLVDQRRLVQFEAIREEYKRLAAEASGRVKAHVVSAGPLDDARRSQLERALTQRTGRQIELDVQVDPKLIGGAIATVGDLVFDGSLRTQLAQLRANLTKGS